jgi:protein-disulfide isomerase
MSRKHAIGSIMSPRRLIAAAVILSAAAAIMSVVAVLMVTGVTGNNTSAESSSLAAQLRAYLLANPEVIIASVQGLEDRQAASAANEMQTFIADNADEIFRSEASPSSGNPNGDVTIVEFFDYNCPYCRKAVPILEEAAAADQGLRVVFKEWPILGPGSEEAARVALAAQVQGKYEPLHKALMAYSGSVDGALALELAADAGLDIERLKSDMGSFDVTAELDRNMALAGNLRITGTPSFVIGEEIVRGLVDFATLRQLIADARSRQEPD